MKRKLIVIVFLSLNFLIQAQTDSKKNSAALYNVKVEIKEVKNRTLECTVRNHKVIVDQPKAFGADDLGPTPPELLAMSYGSCITSTIQFMAYMQHIKISDIKVEVEGQIDFSKAMGISEVNRAGFSKLNTKISFKSEMSDLEKKQFIEKVMTVGAAIDNLANSTPIEYEIINNSSKK